MIVYLVELEMDAALRDEYLAWLRGHVAEMRALPGFLGADILAPVDPPPAEGRGVLYAQYRLRDRSALAHLPCRTRSEDAGGRSGAVRRPCKSYPPRAGNRVGARSRDGRCAQPQTGPRGRPQGG